MRFWEKHSEEMRRARLLQTAATILVSSTLSHAEAVRAAIRLEKEVTKQTKENNGEQSNPSGTGAESSS